MGRKSKFTLEERISMCKNYLEMGLSRKDIFRLYNIYGGGKEIKK